MCEREGTDGRAGSGAAAGDKRLQRGGERTKKPGGEDVMQMCAMCKLAV